MLFTTPSIAIRMRFSTMSFAKTMKVWFPPIQYFLRRSSILGSSNNFLSFHLKLIMDHCITSVSSAFLTSASQNFRCGMSWLAYTTSTSSPSTLSSPHSHILISYLHRRYEGHDQDIFRTRPLQSQVACITPCPFIPLATCGRVHLRLIYEYEEM